MVPNPAKVFCVGLNYKAHIEETGRSDSDYPVLFPKFASSLAGPFAELELPPESHQIDYEGELTVVIGQPGRRISEEDAAAHVLGYTVANDISMRDYQYKTHQWMQGKAWDACTPLGPYLVTRGRARHHQAADLHHRQRREGPGLKHRPADLPDRPADRDDLRVHRAEHRRPDPDRHPLRRRPPPHPAPLPQVRRRRRRRGHRRRRPPQHHRLAIPTASFQVRRAFHATFASSAVGGEDFADLARGVVDQYVAGGRVGPPPARSGVQDQAE